MFRKNFVVLTAATLLTAVTACTKQDSDDSGGSGGGGENPKSAFQTSCGTVIGGKLRNPASPSDGFRSAVTVLGANLVSVNLPSGPLLVKLHGLGAPSDDAKAASAQTILKSLATQEGIFIPADSGCTTGSGSSSGALGQMFTASGESYSEALLSRGLADVREDPCGGELIDSCYDALEEEASKKFAGEIGRLLWKPVSDSNGRLAVHTEPYGASVKVNGELGTNQGAGNGYGSLARFTKAGCAYGGNVQVQVFNEAGAAYTFNGSTTITIPNGCSRTCLEGGTLAQCSKS